MSTDIIILILLVVILAIDLWLAVDEIEGNTFSQRMWILARKFPTIPLFCGYLMGHFFG